MSQDQRFEQRWQFRRKANDLDSSSTVSAPDSGSEMELKKNKVVGGFISAENEESSDHLTKEKQNTFKKDHKENNQPPEKHTLDISEMHRRALGKDKLQRSKSAAYNYDSTASINSLKTYTGILLEELKVAKEDLLKWMDEEMGKSLVKSVKGKKSGKTNNSNEVSEKQTVDGEVVAYTSTALKETTVIAHLALAEKERIGPLGLSTKKPNSATDQSGKASASSYLTSPAVLPQPQAEDNKGRLIDSSTRQAYFNGVHQECRFFPQTGSENMGGFDQNRNLGSAGNGFPFPQCLGLNGGFSIPNTLSGMRMNGGDMRLFGGNHDLEDNKEQTTI
ncbi:hypothetical protein Nepgr_023816 [Nepenthes gracilis]|uniref:Uncharacterized protein n=1 Tax=Nepenthes gracilis TaxID=150966 RepID=A0AAD3XY69_NEPGR|nr:hypothetical protein Nepgr_023816 [Nepenthes gracilis]